MVGASSPDNATAVPPPLAGEEERVVDKRDLRDPEAVGSRLIARRVRERQLAGEYGHTLIAPCSEVADLLVHDDIRDYDPSPPDHAADRKRELEARAAADDKFAKALLDGDTLAEDPTD